MNARDALKPGFAQAEMICNGYLGDLTDEEIFERPVEGINHIAWQLGHLIASEHFMIDKIKPGSMTPLPEGFAEKHSNATAGVDDPSAFLSKAEYVQLALEQRAGTMAVLESLSDDELGEPVPESLRHFSPTVAGIFSMQPVHWLMHAGQWAVTRRRLGRPPLF